MPDRPAAWLAVAARNKALDRLRRDARLDPFDEGAALRLGFSDPERVGQLDDTLALMFVACHPELAPDEQTMLTLKTVCGFGVKEIARAYLSTPEAVMQRLVRAKRKIGGLGLRFEIPEGPELAERLPGLIHAIYLLFNGGYTSDEGDALMRRELCAEALRLVTLLTGHPATATGECHALAALICFHHPPVTLGMPYVDGIRQFGAERLAAVVERHPQVVALLCGHAHTAAVTTFAGRPLVAAPGVVSTSMLPFETDELLDLDQPPMIAFHLLDDDRRLTTHYRAVGS